MKEHLEEQYQELLRLCDLNLNQKQGNINQIIMNSIKKFTDSCSVPAIWCYGKHTKMLMTDFISEMRNVRYIIDANYSECEESGFRIIKENEIRDNHIDGIIISSFKYKDEIKKNMKNKYPDITYLDIYEELEAQGILLSFEYFSQQHPYGHYTNINNWRRNIENSETAEKKEKWYRLLIAEYILIKDFKSALSCIEQAEIRLDTGKFHDLYIMIKEMYFLEQEAASRISDNNVLMICMDGLREKDLENNRMPKILEWICKEGFFYKNTYSMSTSTLESLIPAYSENADLRTKYFERNIIEEKDCRFVNEAVRQKRKIYFYTDYVPYVNSKHVKITDKMQTATEKIWDFILDAVDEDNGLYYLHILYESHFSYPNPYTVGTLVADGTNIMFDYLSINGQKLRTDYGIQHRDALQYLDDVLTPLLGRMQCRMVMYADHGNIILSESDNLGKVERTKFSFHKDLIHVPLIIKSPEISPGSTIKIESLMSLNMIILDLMNHEAVTLDEKEYVKVVRSEIYNPDFRYLYNKYGRKQELLAFEVFIFADGSKLAVYADGKTEMFHAEDDQEVTDDERKKQLLSKVSSRITVCELSALKN